MSISSERCWLTMRPTWLALSVICFVPSFGCIVMDLPLKPESTPVSNDSAPDEGPLMHTELPERVSIPSPASLKDASVVHRRLRSSPIRQVSAGQAGTAPLHKEAIGAREVSGKEVALGPAMSPSQRMEKLNSPDRDNPSLVVSEVILFLVVGTVFVLVHVSRKRPLKPVPHDRLAKLLHNRPWR